MSEWISNKYDEIIAEGIRRAEQEHQISDIQCPICSDKQYLFSKDEEGNEVAEPCECLKRKWKEQKIAGQEG